jgi:putative DNA primase/helicase
VAFTAGNLAHVVRALRGRYPAVHVLVCGDDDADTQARTGKNPGREKATDAARVAQCPPVFPVGLSPGGSDFNDLHQAAGPEAVRILIEQAIQAAEERQARAEPTGQKAGPTRDPNQGPNALPATRQRPRRGANGNHAADIPGDRFRLDEDGLWFDAPADDSADGTRAVRVCGPLHVAALARDAQDGGAALLLEFDTPFRAGRQWLMPLAMLAGDGTAYRAELLAQGFMVPTDAKRRALLTAYLQGRRPGELVRIVDRVGWHQRAYVLPRETLGDGCGERFMFQSDSPTEGTFGQHGTLEQWQRHIAALCVGNSRLILAACCALAAPLVRWTGEPDGRGVHLVGDSRCGKTTALRVAASVMGSPAYMQRWRATDNGLEGMAAQHSDALLCLDELAQIDPKVAGEAAYMLANGQGKSRAGRTGTARPRLSWLLVFLSTGEIGLAEHMAEAGKRVRAGQELRMIDIPADAGGGLGIFETLHQFENGGAMAEHLKVTAAKCYGTPGRAWLEWLTGNTNGLTRELRGRIEATEPQVVPEGASGQVRDAGRFFSLLAVAGEMATERGITGWPVGEALAGVRRCFNAWLAARPAGLGQSEDVQIIRQLREWFGTYGEINFKRWGVTDSDHSKDVPMMAGWRKPVYGDETNSAGALVQVEVGRVWFVLADKFRTTVCKGLPHHRALDLLARRGLLIAEPSGRRLHRARPPGETKDGADVYRIPSAILSAPDED